MTFSISKVEWLDFMKTESDGEFLFQTKSGSQDPSWVALPEMYTKYLHIIDCKKREDGRIVLIVEWKNVDCPSPEQLDLDESLNLLSVKNE